MANPLLFADTRYNRQELIPQIGQKGQLALTKARVAVVGAGGVKSPLLYYLAAAGVGALRIIDHDNVELSNLNRQILFSQGDIGKNKAVVAKSRLMALNPDIEIEAIGDRVSSETIDDYLTGFDVIVEGGDSPAGRLMINSFCISKGIPMVHASAQYNYGYVFTVLPGTTACFRCIFPDLPSSHGGSVPVLGIATGLAGTLGAGEVIKLVTGVGHPIVDGMLMFSGFQSDFHFVSEARRLDCPACGNSSGPSKKPRT